MSKKETRCPLCGRGDPLLFFEDKKRQYVRCGFCKLVFVPASYWISVEEERTFYDLHENDPADPGYRAFLSRLSIPLLNRLTGKYQGLDFGCGPGPALSCLLEEGGQKMTLYDPIYFNNPEVLERTYDFITATEVMEHLHDPDKEFTRLFGMLEKKGHLGIMTKLVTSRKAFAKWHYIRDMTHVCFYSRDTFEYIAHRFDAELTFIGKDVILLRASA